ncbi:SIS domain-containing protein [Nocardioides deserti]|uniref:SIS domain-containing protein n=1 Tax=Nocardioides deserti TaxID=1588644 RepID=A0ABR6U4G1_9ACTN|nr:SIS domain-containing protein [Nocardioides deserti]MBC2959309.1 SIS domain-containing protein [Nocardioides deserti]GGO68078.1 glutamine-fructose-6-phosphate transaminase [Nocardioides deserti]
MITPVGEQMAREIAEQPPALSRLLHDTAQVREVARRIREARPRFVVLAARGTSDHAALYAKYLIEISLGLPVGLASPSTLTVYGARPHLNDVLWVAVSQSGGSPDLVRSTETARACGALTVAVTNAPDSPLAAAAELGVDVLAGPERAVAATKTYTSQLLALWLLVDHWRGGDGRTAAGLPDHVGSALDTPGIDGLASRLRFAPSLICTARGYSYPTAREAALKLMETSYVAAQAFSGADLLHGPLALVDADRPVLAVVGPGDGGRAMAPTLERLAAQRAELTVIGDPAGVPDVHTVVPLPADIPEELSPIVEIVPLQRLAHRLAVTRQHDPDAPRGLAKVTSTI